MDEKNQICFEDYKKKYKETGKKLPAIKRDPIVDAEKILKIRQKGR